MGYEKELQFVEKLLCNFRLNLRYLTKESTEQFTVLKDIGLKDVLNYDYDEESLLELMEQNCKLNTIYKIKNLFMCNYLLFRLPNTATPVFAYIGPYTLAPISKPDILKLAEEYHVTPGNLTQLEQFYLDMPLLSDENMLLTLVYTLGEILWGNADQFTLCEDFQFPVYSQESIIPITDIQTPEEALLSVQIVEKRYEAEQQLIHAVSNGQLHKAELFFANISSRQYEQRSNNPLRDMKNYGIVLNTLLRKAAESAAVHPIHIDHISSQYARKLEALTSQSACMSMLKEMIRKYCLLVKNHSLKGYSLLIRKVITGIDYDLTADLSLKTQAQLLNVNPSYLSTLFKKETGSTLTEYVNRKRIEHALLLLNSTDMQIQMIAQYCGIQDVNYFTKTFKKMVGKTPKEYREMITSHF
ncbi:MAG: helix-turn-helix transcriptional regulator [Lachnospiraceae bacterium]|nr:helix-turn-helix transcriptional regulator [Lachnospiraceae bacterium]